MCVPEPRLISAGASLGYGDVSDRSALRPRAETLIQEVRARIPGMRGLLLRALVRYREIRFPAFQAVHTAITASDDYLRYTTLGAPRRVIEEEIPGVIAGVGGWHGETSAFPHRVAPQRRFVPVRHVREVPRSGPATGRRGRAAPRYARRRNVALDDVVQRDPHARLRPGHANDGTFSALCSG